MFASALHPTQRIKDVPWIGIPESDQPTGQGSSSYSLVEDQPDRTKLNDPNLIDVLLLHRLPLAQIDSYI